MDADRLLGSAGVLLAVHVNPAATGKDQHDFIKSPGSVVPEFSTGVTMVTGTKPSDSNYHLYIINVLIC